MQGCIVLPHDVMRPCRAAPPTYSGVIPAFISSFEEHAPSS